MQLLVETDIETGLRWGELAELRVKDIDFVDWRADGRRASSWSSTRGSTRRVGRFLVKHYPKDKEWRQLRVADHLLEKIRTSDRRAEARAATTLSSSCRSGPSRGVEFRPNCRTRETLGWTEPNENGPGLPPRHVERVRGRAVPVPALQGRHGGIPRVAPSAQGKDQPRTPRQVDTDGHIGRDWFRRNVWLKALDEAQLGFHVTPNAPTARARLVAARRRRRSPGRQGAPRPRQHHHHREVPAHLPAEG